MSWVTWVIRHNSQYKPILWGVAASAVVVQWVRAVVYTHGDFDLHWSFGRRFATGQFLYAGGMDVPYPPFWGMAWAPLTLLPVRVAQILLFPLSIVALATLLFILRRLTREYLPLGKDGLFWCTALTLGLSSRFILRELIECGPNLSMVALTWMALYFWLGRRELWGGVCLGLAIALKCTPALFLPFLACKRQWKMVFLTILFALLFTLAPALRQGRSDYVEHLKTWVGNVWHGVVEPDPSRGVLGEEKVQNIALRPALARLLMRLPAGHLSRLEHPWYVDFFDLQPSLAGILVKAVLLLILVALAWVFRGRPEPHNYLEILWECAAVSVLILLYSPITWEQHCVWVIPACYLIASTSVACGEMTGWTTGALGIYTVLVLLLNRELVGRNFSLLLYSYHITTWGLLVLLAITLRGRFRAAGHTMGTLLKGLAPYAPGSQFQFEKDSQPTASGSMGWKTH